MAAPIEAYTGLSLFTGDCEHRQAILDPNYSTFKTRFYLDEVIGGKSGVIGCVTPLGENAGYHNMATRGGKGRIGSKIVLNDAGLNTLGKPTLNSNSLQWANNVRNSYTFLSAYYVDSSFTGVRFRVGAGAWTEVSFFTTLPMATSQTVTKDFDSGLTKGTVIEMQAIIKNAEGDKYSDPINIALKSNIYQNDVFKRTTACNAVGQTTVSLWNTQDTLDLLPTIPENTSTATGVYLYTDIEQTAKAGTGWYIGLDGDKVFFVDGTGQITHYVMCSDVKGTIYLSLEQDGEGFLNPVHAFVDPVYTVVDIVVTGRVDIQPVGSTPDGKDFTITIPAGVGVGEMTDFNLPYSGSETYYWQNVSSVPTGFTIETQEI